MGTGVLSDIRVVEFAQNAAVPYCGRLMAALGADVVKVEPPGGDAMRFLVALADGEAKGYAVINPGKRSLCLDLGHPRSRSVIDGLLRWADVALIGLKRTDLARYGLDEDRVRAVNPALIHLAGTALGPRGPDADDPGYDLLAQARSGNGFILSRSRDGVPTPARPAVNDFATGMVSLAAVLAALRHRDRTGEGQRVDTSLLGTAMGLGTAITSLFEVDHEPVAALTEDLDLLRSSGADFDTVRDVYESRVLSAQGAFHLYFRYYATSDGLVAVAGLNAGLFDKFHRVTGLPRPPAGGDPADPDFQAVVTEAEDLFATRSTADWLEALSAVGYPCGRFNTPTDALTDDQVVANDYLVDLDHPTIGRYRTTGVPFHLDATPAAVPGPSPGLGEHTTDVLAEIGLSSAQIDELAANGVVGPAAAQPHPDPDRPDDRTEKQVII